MTELSLGVDLAEGRASAAVLDERNHLLARLREPSRADEPGSVESAVRGVLAGSEVDPRAITRAVLGSPSALEALERRRGLGRVAVLRIGGPLTLAIPPLAGWPADLRSAVSVGEAVVEGGASYDGRPMRAFDVEGTSRFLAAVAEHADAVAVTSVFSPLAPEHELAAAELARHELGLSVPISLSHEIGTLGLLERENATVLNAALLGFARNLLASFQETLDGCGIDAEPFFAQGDGTVMTLEHALRFPLYLLGSGPASAIRGAGWLSGVSDGLTAEVRADETATIGGLAGDSPRQRRVPNRLAGIRANFRLPDLRALRSEDGVAAGGASAAAADARPRPGLGEEIAHAGLTLDGGGPMGTLVVHGDGADRVPEHLPGVAEVVHPRDGDVAGAVGLLIAPVGGQVDRICSNRPSLHATTREAARAEALARAIHAGADPSRVQIVDIEEVPLTYLLDPPIRVRIRAEGPRI